MPELLEAKPERVLAVYAHPDDAEVSCGGTLARWAAEGAAVHVVVCTRGDKGSTDPKVDGDALADARRHEVQDAGRVLGVAEHHFLDHGDGDLENDRELRAELVRIVREVRPEVVVCPDPEAAFFGQSYFNHRDHRVVGWATLDAVSPAAGNPHYFPDAGPAHQVGAVYLSGTLVPDVWCDISGTVDAKAEALLCHRSKVGEGAWLRNAVRERAEEAGRSAGVAYAEAFRRLVLGGSSSEPA